MLWRAITSSSAALARSMPASSGGRSVFPRYHQMRFYADLPPHVKISMPALSPTMTSGNIGNWHKKVGDEISPGDVLVEIETDKAQMDFECQEEGYLAKILMEAGSKEVAVNVPIAILVEKEADVAAFANYSGADSAAAKPAPVTKVETTTPATAPSAQQVGAPVAITNAATHTAAATLNGGRILASPVAKKLAAERGIDLSTVPGTGPLNRITKYDVLSYKPSAAAVPQSAPATTVAAASAASSSVSRSAVIAPMEQGEFTDLPLTNMRRIIANRLQESKSNIPHYYLTAEITMDKVLKLRQELNGNGAGRFKLSVNDFIVKAAALSLKQIPEVNSQFSEQFIRQFDNVDISVAVATPSGLITPIVKNADQKGLATISNDIKDLAGRARDNKLAPNEYQGGTFTISNLGMFGIKQFTAIINPPQSCILAVGSTAEKLVVDNNNARGFSTVKTMHVTLSCDHRVVDGAVGSQWLAKFKELLEDPVNLLL